MLDPDPHTLLIVPQRVCIWTNPECVSLAGKKAEELALISELQEHVKSTTAPYKYPRKIDLVDSLPKV